MGSVILCKVKMLYKEIVMQIEELNLFVKLFDTYGKLLSNKQYEVMDKFLNYNLSESELAELDSGSRQSIHDAITKAKKQLLDFEEKCQIVKFKELAKDNLLKVKAFLNESEKNQSVESLIDGIINNL